MSPQGMLTMHEGEFNVEMGDATVAKLQAGDAGGKLATSPPPPAATGATRKGAPRRPGRNQQQSPEKPPAPEVIKAEGGQCEEEDEKDHRRRSMDYLHVEANRELIQEEVAKWQDLGPDEGGGTGEDDDEDDAALLESYGPPQVYSAPPPVDDGSPDRGTAAGTAAASTPRAKFANPLPNYGGSPRAAPPGAGRPLLRPSQERKRPSSVDKMPVLDEAPHEHTPDHDCSGGAETGVGTSVGAGVGTGVGGGNGGGLGGGGSGAGAPTESGRQGRGRAAEQRPLLRTAVVAPETPVAIATGNDEQKWVGAAAPAPSKAGPGYAKDAAAAPLKKKGFLKKVFAKK